VDNLSNYPPEVHTLALLDGPVLEDMDGLVGTLAEAIGNFEPEHKVAEGALVYVEDHILGASSLEALEGRHNLGVGKLKDLGLTEEMRVEVVDIDWETG
jgi:hypothetical protein